MEALLVGLIVSLVFVSGFCTFFYVRYVLLRRQLRKLVRSFLGKEGQESCWYYPDIFREVAERLGVPVSKVAKLPTLADFKRGCTRHQTDLFGTGGVLMPPEELASRYRITEEDGAPVDPNGEFFVLRLDCNTEDPIWARACRVALRALSGELLIRKHKTKEARAMLGMLNALDIEEPTLVFNDPLPADLEDDSSPPG